MTVSARGGGGGGGGLNSIYSTETGLLEIHENQTLNIGVKVISMGQNIRKSSILATFGLSMTWTGSKMIWLRERDSGKRETRRAREE